MDEPLTVAEVASRLQVHQATVRAWIEKGEFPAYRIGERRVRVSREDFSERGSTTATPEDLHGTSGRTDDPDAR
jgi:excisionase family DNA binding protein